ncbi:hypothetical protein BSKO_06228 [Bryopsis sp. KO-2023]|nr:hypothetical protein BSKO_06228 [Bryopsis sp. KO-2023]
MNERRIMLDPGWGGSRPGAVANGLTTKGLNLSTGLMVADYLQEKGYNVAMTRTTDVFIPLIQRVGLANELGVDLYVSIHYNAAFPTGHGAEVFVHGTEGEAAGRCAEAVLAAVVGTTGFRNRGVKSGDYYVLEHTHMPAILICPGFVSSLRDSEQLGKISTIREIARAIGSGVDEYFSQHAAGHFLAQP